MCKHMGTVLLNCAIFFQLAKLNTMQTILALCRPSVFPFLPETKMEFGI